MKNPLIKRIPRELFGEWHKYLVIFLFLTLTIGFVAGMYVANDSMLTSAEDYVEECKQEDGHFELDERASGELLAAMESGDRADEEEFTAVPVTIYENFYRDRDEDHNLGQSILRQRTLARIRSWEAIFSTYLWWCWHLSSPSPSTARSQRRHL